MQTGYFDEDGNPISLQEWGRKFEDFESRILLRDELPDDRGLLLTVWLGYVDPDIDGAQLFGTALLKGKPVELDTYDCKQDAIVGHARHKAALTDRDDD